jgi:hypothetical protein
VNPKIIRRLPTALIASQQATDFICRLDAAWRA